MLALLIACSWLIPSAPGSVLADVDAASPERLRSMSSARNFFRVIPNAPLSGVDDGDGKWLIAAVVAAVLLAGVAGCVSWVNARLRYAKERLEGEVTERKRAALILQRSENALRDLHRIMARHDLTSDDRIHAFLVLGCRLFRMPVGTLMRFDGDKFEIAEVVPAGSLPSKGSICSIESSICRHTVDSAEPVAVQDASGREAPADLICCRQRARSCLGMRVEAGGSVYGALNFIGFEPRAAPFTTSDLEILRLMAQLVGGEIERRSAESRWQMLAGALEQTADVVEIVNCRGDIEYVNRAFERVTGYTRLEAVGNTPKLLQSGRHDAEFYDELWRTVLAGEVYRGTFLNRRKDGSLYHEEKTITPLLDRRGDITHFVSTGKDVTKRKLAEERARQRQAQVAHTQRVSAMGEMAASLAHELNQPLAAIVNYAQGCILRLRDGEVRSDEFLRALERIAAEGNRSGEIIRRVREFLRKSKPRRTRVDINQVVREATDLASFEARRRDVALKLDLTHGLPLVLADAIQIEQVVLNLVYNAVEAIDDAHCPQREVIVRTGPDPGNGIEVIVRDTGPGLPMTDPERLFAPFYSTKSGGMGMGLSISRSIIEAHGEQLQVHANAAGGASFRFVLPTLEQEALQ